MAAATLNQWKQFMEGLRRGDIGPYEWRMRTDRVDRYREFYSGRTRRAWMRVIEGRDGSDNGRKAREFDVHTDDLIATDYIYIPTDQEIEDWGDEGLDIEQEIASRERRP